MSRATTIANRVDGILKQYAPPLFSVYKRIVSTTGGDGLIGRPGTVTNTDTLLSPQPVYARGMRRQVGGTDADDVTTSSGVRIANSYEMTISRTALSEAEIENSNTLLLFEDSAGVQEVYRIEDYEPMAINGELVAWLVYATSMSR